MGTRTLLLCFLLFPVALATAAPPSPNLRQLRIGAYTYGGSSIWTSSNQANNAAIRDWYAKRYSFAMGSGASSKADMAQMKTINPSMKGLIYQLYLPDSNWTTDIKNWCTSKGYNVRDLLLHTRSGTGDSAVCRSNPTNPTGFGRWVTTKPGRPLLGPGFTVSQTRLLWDFRSPKVGEYLAQRWKAQVAAMGYDGAFVDEEFIIGYTNNSVAGNYCVQAPFRDITKDYWAVGGPYSWDKPWPTTMTIVQIRDSLRNARNGWQKTAGSIMKSAGYFYAPNFAAIPTATYANWEFEGRHAAVLCGSYVIGEYSYFYPSNNGNEPNCNNAVKAMYSIKDSSVNMFVGWIRMGQYDLANGVSYDRSKMNGLGLMLDCTFPGTSTAYFSPCVKNGQVDFKSNRETIANVTVSDTVTMWCYAWGKYFGVPLNTRDTAQKGTDPAGQTYTMHKVKLLDSTKTRTQTLAVGRYARGSNYSLTSTRVAVSLGGTFYELLPSGKFSGPVTSTAVGNAEWRVFVADTAAANRGTGTTSGGGGGGMGGGSLPGCSADSTLCLGRRGNVDCDALDNVDIADLTTLVKYLFVTGNTICCPREANVDGDVAGNVDVTDLAVLSNYLYGAGIALPGCATPIAGDRPDDGNNVLVDTLDESVWEWTKDLPNLGIHELEFDNDTTNDTLAVPDSPLWPWTDRRPTDNPEAEN